MMPDLPPDVRAEAAAAVYELASVDTDDSATFTHAVVDAVVAVVAPEIERPLKAELDQALKLLHGREMQLQIARNDFGALTYNTGEIVRERDALQARIAELEALAEMWESRAKEVDAHRRALWDITGRDPKVWSEAHARAALAKGEKP